jgi:hypothetical protein
MKILKPDLSIERLTDLDFVYWYAKGIRCVLVDLDNTIAPWRQTSITDDARAMIAKAREAGMTVALFTNAPESRAKEAAWDAGIGYFHSAAKPFPGKYRKAFSELSANNEEVMCIGDQIFTDVLGGNCMGCVTVLIPPLSEIEFSGTKILRWMEKHLAGRKEVFRDSPASK